MAEERKGWARRGGNAPGWNASAGPGSQGAGDGVRRGDSGPGAGSYFEGDFGNGEEPYRADGSGEEPGTSREGYGDYEPRGGYGFGDTLPRSVGEAGAAGHGRARVAEGRRADPEREVRGTAGHWGRPAPGRDPRGTGLEGVDEGPHAGRGPQGYRRADERIYEDVCERLTRHGQIDASGMRVAVSDGEVILEGTVGDRRVKSLAEEVADSVSGVRDVHNRLRVERGGPERAD